LPLRVANEAPASFTKTLTVPGGCEVNASNDAASDHAGEQSRQCRGDDGASVLSAKSRSAVLDNVANAFTHSDEYLANLVTRNYLQLLRRTPSAAEVSTWVGLLK